VNPGKVEGRRGGRAGSVRLYSAEALAERKRVRELLAQSRELLKQMQAAEPADSRRMGFVRGILPKKGLRNENAPDSFESPGALAEQPSPEVCSPSA
jgi:hypothetical protein